MLSARQKGRENEIIQVHDRLALVPPGLAGLHEQQMPVRVSHPVLRLSRGPQVISEADKGWFAGILDFQGHVVRRANGHRAEGSEHLSIYVDTKITPITMKMSAMTGTSPEPKDHHAAPRVEWLRRRCVEHCPEPHDHVSEDVIMPPTVKWSCTGAAAAIILWNLRPYMTTDHEPWDWAMGMCFASTRLSGRGAQAALSAIRRLHSLGWELPPLFREVIPKELEAAS